MKFRPIAACVGLVALLTLAACGGSGSMNSSEAKAPQRDNAAAQPTSAATAKNNDDDTARAQISTFALDVDTASYSYARRTLQDGGRPSPGQVRAEEFVNSFRQDYAQPQADGFTVHVDGARMGADNTAVVRVGLQTRASDAVARRPANLTFVVDNSGSMAEAAASTWSRTRCTSCSTSSAPATRCRSWPSPTRPGCSPR